MTVRRGCSSLRVDGAPSVKTSSAAGRPSGGVVARLGNRSDCPAGRTLGVEARALAKPRDAASGVPQRSFSVGCTRPTENVAGALVGYVRVSTQDQDTALQVAAMRSAGVTRIFEEKRSSVVDRPQLRAALAALGPGDTLCVYKIDRLARSLWDLMGLLRQLEAGGAAFRSLTEPIETTSPAGRLMVQILGAFAEFERGVIRERCEAGRIEARAKGIRFGRPPKLDRPAVLELLAAGESIAAVARRYKVDPSSVSRCAKGAR